jgi:hypothetical protein
MYTTSLHFAIPPFAYTLLPTVTSSLLLLGSGFQVSDGGRSLFSGFPDCPRVSAAAAPTASLLYSLHCHATLSQDSRLINCTRESERERERERERKLGVAVRDTTNKEGVGNNISDLKVSRHCPLVLLIGVRLEFKVNSTFFLQCYWSWRGCIGAITALDASFRVKRPGTDCVENKFKKLFLSNGCRLAAYLVVVA